LEWTTGVTFARILQVTTTHTKLSEGHGPSVGLGTGGSRLQGHIRLEQDIRGGAIFRGAPASNKVGTYLLRLLLQLLRDGQANGFDVLCLGSIKLVISLEWV